MSNESGDWSPESGGYKAPRWAWWIATGFGSGRLKPGPGTWGSLAALIAWSALVGIPWLIPGQPHRNKVIFAAVLGAPIITALAILSSSLIVRETGIKDPGFIVADEWAGLWIAMIPSAGIVYGCLYFITYHSDPYWTLIAPIAVPFLLFRLFDIWKPWPIFRLQALPGGWGVVVDDLVAGLYAALVTIALMPWFPMGPGKG